MIRTHEDISEQGKAETDAESNYWDLSEVVNKEKQKSGLRDISWVF